MAPSVRGEVSSLQQHHHHHHQHHHHHPHQGETASEEQPRPGFVKLATSQLEKNIYVHSPEKGLLNQSLSASPTIIASSASILSPTPGDSCLMEDEGAVADDSSPAKSSRHREKPPLDDDDHHQQQQSALAAVNEPEASVDSNSATLSGHEQPKSRLLR